MNGPGQFSRRITFRQQTTDADGEASGYEDVVTRDALIEPLRGAESVQAARLAGKQPVKITLYRDSTTKLIDNGWQAKDARAAQEVPPRTIVWDITSAVEIEERGAAGIIQYIEIEAEQRKGGDVE